MERLYRLVIKGWWPVLLDEEQARTMTKEDLQVLYEDCAINPYDVDDLTLSLECATEEDNLKYGKDELW